MTIQYIIDRAQQIEIDRRRIVGQTISRSQRIKTQERSTAQPWKFKITPPGSIPYAQARGVVEVIDFNDRVGEYEITFSNSTGTAYIQAYQGGFQAQDLAAITIHAVGTDTFTLTNLGSLAPPYNQNTVLLARGDIIQPANSRYPYTVAETCLRGSNTTTQVTLHRNVITSEGISLVDQTLKVGTTCTWRVIVSAMPSYSLVPGKRLQFNGDFELIEKII